MRITNARSSGSHGLLPLLVAAFLAAAPVAAQDTGPDEDGGSSASSSSGLAPIPREDFGRWERLGQAELSPDGRWLATGIGRVSEEDELRVQPVADPDSVIVVPYGSAATFSEDGRWLAFSVGMSEDAREALRKRDEPVRDDLGLVDLTTGERTTVEDVASFAFSGDGRWLAMRRYPPQGEREADGVDVVVRDLADGTDLSLGNVSEYAWRDGGALLAMIVDAEGRVIGHFGEREGGSNVPLLGHGIAVAPDGAVYLAGSQGLLKFECR
ncbi:MAG: hypothetical protein KY453_08930 [Gemmatimonadetes bacterium]|nr:hypothetical protein [Gemmatimonadota bacterium]